MNRRPGRHPALDWRAPGCRPSRFLLSSGVEGSAGDLASILKGTALPVFVVGLAFAAIWDRWRRFAVLVALHFAIDLLPSLRHAAGGTF